MKINETNLSFKNMSTRSRTSRIILHHAAAKSCDAATIHQWHLNKNWSGIGYHFVVRKDGTIERGRPEKYVGAHATGANSDSIGICFEGTYMTETMPAAQRAAGKELVAYLKGKYKISKVQRHKDVGSTSCPGKNFPFAEIAGATGGGSGAASSVHVSGQKANTPQNGNASWISRLQTECNRQGFSRQKVDGIAGPNTLAGCPQLGRASKGNITSLLQERLNALGYNCGKVDGINGTKTQAAIKAYQKAKGLVVDGIVGPKTWSKLLGLS